MTTHHKKDSSLPLRLAVAAALAAMRMTRNRSVEEQAELLKVPVERYTGIEEAREFLNLLDLSYICYVNHYSISDLTRTLDLMLAWITRDRLTEQLVNGEIDHVKLVTYAGASLLWLADHAAEDPLQQEMRRIVPDVNVDKDFAGNGKGVGIKIVRPEPPVEPA